MAITVKDTLNLLTGARDEFSEKAKAKAAPMQTPNCQSVSVMFEH
jgi:hypothetical protein